MKGYTQLVVSKSGSYHWTVKRNWYTPYGVVPKGFVSDGASVPRIFWWVMTPTGVLFEASVLHDFLYESAWGTKGTADKAFYRTARRYGAGKLKARLAYMLVNMFGKGKYPPQ